MLCYTFTLAARFIFIYIFIFALYNLLSYAFFSPHKTFEFLSYVVMPKITPKEVDPPKNGKESWCEDAGLDGEVVHCTALYTTRSLHVALGMVLREGRFLFAAVRTDRKA